MAQLLDEPDARIRSIIFGTLDVTGMSARAQELALANGRFRPFLSKVSIEDVRATMGECDRAVQLDWNGKINPTPLNLLAGSGVSFYELVVSNCVLYGPDTGTHVRNTGSEVKSELSLFENAKRRANGDADEIELAITFFELHGNDTSPSIVSIVVNSTPTITRVQGEKGYRVIYSQRYTVKLARNPLAPKRP